MNAPVPAAMAPPTTDGGTVVAVNADDIERAAAGLAGAAVRTPLLESPLLNRRLGFRLLIKAECLQRTGSFKLRGAWTRLAAIPTADRPLGVLAYSSGNHAQGVAAAAAAFGIPATIVMPADAPAIKRRNTEAWGARIVSYDRYQEDREAIGAELAARSGATLVKPYDDPAVIAGQGTVGLEILEQCTALDIVPDALLVPCGGGGLTAGTAILCQARDPHIRVCAVEPEGFDDTRRSLLAGRRLCNGEGGLSSCDALLAPAPGEITFGINHALGVTGLAVSEAETTAAIAEAFATFKLVLEPGGAVALAAALAGKGPSGARTLVAVASGGNVDAESYARLLRAGAINRPV